MTQRFSLCPRPQQTLDTCPKTAIKNPRAAYDLSMPTPLNDDAHYLALKARDARFDGRFLPV